MPVDGFDRHAVLVWIHTHNHSAHPATSCLSHLGEDGQSYFEPGNPLLSHASPAAPGGPHAR